MEFSRVMLVLSMFFKISLCLRCFKCIPENIYDGTLLCKDFDGSERFIEECEHSTMCFKRMTTITFGNGMTSSTFRRDCAPQTIEGDQARINGKWQHVHTIYEKYDEGCKEDSDPERPTKTTNCYCRGDLCNGSNINFISFYMLLLSFIIYFLS